MFGNRKWRCFPGFKDQEKVGEANTVLYSYLMLHKTNVLTSTTFYTLQQKFKMFAFAKTMITAQTYLTNQTEIRIVEI